VAYLANEIVACLLGAGLLGLLFGWLLKSLGAKKQVAALRADLEQSLNVTESELQRVTAELGSEKKSVAELRAAMEPLAERLRDQEAKLLDWERDKETLALRFKEQAAEVERARTALAAAEQRWQATVNDREAVIQKLEASIAESRPVIADAANWKARAGEWERQFRDQREMVQQQQADLLAWRERHHAIEALPAVLAEREAQIQQLEERHRQQEAAQRARVQELEAALMAAEDKVIEAGRILQTTEAHTAHLLDERAADIRALQMRLDEVEPLARLWQQDREQAPLAMAAAAGSSSPGSMAGAVVEEAPAAAPVELSAADLQGCLASLLFERRLQFVPKSDELLAESAVTLNEISELMEQAPGVPVVIEGHTDNWGDPHTNWQLSVRRAEAVRFYLTLRGIPESRLSCVGYGEARPVDDNATPDGRWRNRRVEMRVAPGAAVAPVEG